MYLKRNIEQTIEKIRYSYPEIYIGGQRQVGKTTTIQMIMGKTYQFVNLRHIDDRVLANSNPRLFFEFHKPPVFIDEIHLAPTLLEEMMVLSDKYIFNQLQNNEKEKNLFFISSSSHLNAIKGINESSAGRIAILEMAGLSMQEQDGHNFGDFVPLIDDLKKRQASHKTVEQIYQLIFNGGMPQIVVNHEDREIFYHSYIESYINKDLREIAHIQKGEDFYRFIKFIAARTAQTVEYSTISRLLGVSVITVKQWFSILESTGIVKFLSPFMATHSNRLIKTKKMYFMDTGLCLFLLGFSNVNSVMNNSLISGSIFETFVVSEIIKSFLNEGKHYDDKLFFYRDTAQKEIDLIYFDGNTITPIEIKKHDHPTKADKNFKVLDLFPMPRQTGIIICNTDQPRPINEVSWEFPVSLI